MKKRHPVHVVFRRDDPTSVCGISISAPDTRMLFPGDSVSFRRDERPCGVCRRELRKALKGTHPTLVFPPEDPAPAH